MTSPATKNRGVEVWLCTLVWSFRSKLLLFVGLHELIDYGGRFYTLVVMSKRNEGVLDRNCIECVALGGGVGTGDMDQNATSHFRGLAKVGLEGYTPDCTAHISLLG